MTNLFSALSVPQMSRLGRRTALVALVLAVVSVAVSIAVGHAIFGVGMCLGMGLAMANFLLVARSTAKAAAQREYQPPPVVANTLLRLGAISAVCLLLAWLVGPLGFGAIVGLALFQFALLANVMVTLVRDPSMGEPGER